MTPAPLPPGRPASPWLPLLALTCLSALTALAMAPLAEAAYRDQPSALVDTARTGLWIAAGAAPLLAAIRGTVLAGIAWAVLVLWGGDPPYRRAWTILITGELILAAQGAWMAVILLLRGPGRITSPGDLGVTTGLDLIFPDPSTPLGALALSVTPFHLAWVLYLAWRLTLLADGRRGRAIVAAVACWLPAPVVAVLRASAG